MTRISFHQKLDNLRERLLQMAGVAEQTLTFALDAHCRGELSACANVRLNEAIINRSEREIDQMALDLLAMEQPMAAGSALCSRRYQDQLRPGAGRRPVDDDCFAGRRTCRQPAV